MPALMSIERRGAREHCLDRFLLAPPARAPLERRDGPPPVPGREVAIVREPIAPGRGERRGMRRPPLTRNAVTRPPMPMPSGWRPDGRRERDVAGLLHGGDEAFLGQVVVDEGLDGLV